MAQVILLEIDGALEKRLTARAGRNGRTLEAEAYAILEGAEPGAPEQALGEDGDPGLTAAEKGFGDLMYERFKDIGLNGDEVRRFSTGITEFNSEWEMGLPDFEQDQYEGRPSET